MQVPGAPHAAEVLIEPASGNWTAEAGAPLPQQPVRPSRPQIKTVRTQVKTISNAESRPPPAAPPDPLPHGTSHPTGAPCTRVGPLS